MDRNILIITLDSCRWDVFKLANTPNIESILDIKCAYTHGTYTLPSHLSIYSGIFPSVKEEIPYYNRFCKQLIRIENRYIGSANYLIKLPKDSKDIISGLRKKGFYTFGVGAVSWFKNKLLTEPFNDFHFTGINIEKQIEIFYKITKNTNSPFLGLLNIGETHEPYEFGCQVAETNHSRARCKTFKEYGFLKDDFNSQIKALEYIDKKILILFRLLETFKRDTIIIMCGDHGECFGEDNMYGHGFYHPKIMEVPLGIGLFSKTELK